MAESFNPQERELIERLRRAPQPTLPPESVAAIRLRLLDALDLPPAAPPGLPPLLLPIVVVIIIAAIIITLIISRPPETPSLAETIAPPSSTPVPSLTPTQTATASLTPTFTVTPSPTVAPTVTLGAVVVIEGPVERIDEDIIVIYGIEVLLPGDNPWSGVIEVGDIVRVEGDPDAGDVIVVISITVVNVEVEVNPQTGEGWRDDGSCSNPPPDWAPANGWRRRCQGGENPGNSGNPGNGNGNGRGNGGGNGDDDD